MGPFQTQTPTWSQFDLSHGTVVSAGNMIGLIISMPVLLRGDTPRERAKGDHLTGVYCARFYVFLKLLLLIRLFASSLIVVRIVEQAVVIRGPLQSPNPVENSVYVLVGYALNLNYLY